MASISTFDDMNLLDKRVDKVTKHLEDVNRIYIQKIARNIKEIGELNASSVNRLSLMMQMFEDVEAIKKALAKAVDLSTKELNALLEQALNDTYHDKRFQRALSQEPLTLADRRRLEGYTQAVSIQTATTLRNLSNTTTLSKVYQQAVDTAILAVTTGLDDYQSATRKVIRELGGNGVQVEYPSGYHRRLDSSVRQNVVDATKQVAQNTSLMMGEMLQYDAVELSAHLMSAPDHEPIQGRVFLLPEFERMQSEQSFRDIDGHEFQPIARSIGQWNCRHVVSSFSTEYSKRRYTDEQLRRWKEDNEAGCTFQGKHYSTYEASQKMRQLETEVRHLKDTAIGAREAGDSELRRECQEKIRAKMKTYNKLADAAELTPRPERMKVEGFRAVRL